MNEANWHPYPAELPPPLDPAKPHWFSQDVWIALSDGTVERANCLHRHPEAKYTAPVHSWFIDSVQFCEPRGRKILAWTAILKPAFPEGLL